MWNILCMPFKDVLYSILGPDLVGLTVGAVL